MKPLSRVPLLAASCLLAFSSNLFATVFTWDASGGAPLGDGAGSWAATGGTNWFNNTASTYGAWGNTSSDEAVFGSGSGAAGIVTVGTVNANKITFNAAGSGSYTLSGGTINLGTTSPTILNNSGAGANTINSNITLNAASTITNSDSSNALSLGGTIAKGTNLLTITGAGATNLTGGLTGTGGLYVDSAGTFTYSATGGTTNDFRVGNGASGNFKITGGDLTVSGGNDILFCQNGTTSTFTQTGGTLNLGSSFFKGANATGQTGTVDVSGGIWSGTGIFMTNQRGTGILNVSGTANMTVGMLALGGWVGDTKTATVNLNGGTLSVSSITEQTSSGGNAGANSGTTSTFNFNGGTLRATASNATFMTNVDTVNVKDGGAKIDTNGFDITIAKALTHFAGATTDSLTKVGVGTLTLSGASTYTGVTNISQGVLKVASTGSLTTTTYNIGADYGASSPSATGLLVFASSQSLNGKTLSSFTVSGTAVSSSAYLRPILSLLAGSTGTLTVTAPAITDQSIVRAGNTYFLTNSNPAQASYIWNTAADGSAISDGAGTWDASTTNKWRKTDALTTNVAWGGGSNIANFGTATAAAGAVTVSGTVSAGGLSFNPAASGTYTLGSGTIDFGTTNGAITTNGTDATISSALAGTNGITKSGTGTLTLSGATTFTGTTAVDAGSLVLSHQNALQNSTLTTGGVVFSSSVTGNAFTLGGLNGSVNAALQNNAATPAAIALSVGNNNTDTSYSGVLSGSGSLVKIGSGKLSLTGSNTYAGTTTISNGTLQVGAGGTSGSLASAGIANNATLSYSRSDTVDINTAITGTGAIIANAGAGTIGFRGSIAAGSVSATSTFSSSGQSLYGSGYAAAINLFTDITTTGNQTYNGVVSIGRGSNATTTLTTTGGGGVTLANGVVGGLSGYWSSNTLSIDTSAGNGAVTLGGTTLSYGVGNLNINSGAGLITLTGGNYYYDYSVFTGNVALTANSTFQNANQWVRGVTFNKDLTGAFTLTASLGNGVASSSGTGTAGLIFNTATTQTVSSIIAGTASLTKSGAGITSLTGDNTYTGATNVNAGTLVFKTPNFNTYRGGQININNGSTVKLEDGGGNHRYDFGTQTYNFDANGGGTITTVGANMNWVGQGTWTFKTNGGAKNIINGDTRMNLNGNSVVLDVTAGTNGASDLDIGIDIGNTTGGLTKTGAGTATLTAANSFTGAAQVNAGKLIVTGSLAAGGTLTVGGATASGSPTLGGTGTINRATVIAAAGGGAAGTHAPAAQASGSGQTFTSTLNYGAGSIFEWDLNAATADTGDTNQGNYGQVKANGAAGSVTGGAAVFKVVLGSNSFADAFWDTDKHWSNIFTGTGAPAALASLFSAFDASGGLDSSGRVAGQGQFTMTSSTLTWSAVPEPTGALAGVMLAAGLLRRRRK